MRGEIGNRYGRLVVIEEAEPTYTRGSKDGRKRKQRRVNCQCDCGNTKEVFLTNLTTGKTESCGCINRTHGLSKSSEYKVWQGMLGRCGNPNHADYPTYGGRGITVCDRWKQSFESFIEDMGQRPTDAHTIERVDVYSGYSPDNCIWLERDKQAANKRKERREHGSHPQYEYRKAARERKARGEYRIGGRSGSKIDETRGTSKEVAQEE